MLRLPPDQMLQRAIAAFRAMQLPFAEQACRAVLSVQPERGEAWLLLAQIMMEAAKLEAVEELLGKAERARAPMVDVLLTRASLLWRQGLDRECLEVCRRVLSLRPGHEESLCRMAACERRMGNAEDAIRRLQPFMNNPVAATIAAWSYLDAKDPEKALAVATACINNPAMQPAQRSNLWHVIGFAHEQRGDYAAALDGYVRSKEAVPVKQDEAATRRNFSELLEVFSAEFLRTAPKATVRTERPVFIAAMPRSGTTLLDRIIAAHPQGAGAGETRALRGQVAEWTGATPDACWPRIVGRFTSEDYDRIARRYLAETDQFGPTAARIADKHLMNWLSVGLIDCAFPAARVVHLRRDPIDVGISCLERLRPGAVVWSASLRSIGIALKACDVLMAHWKSVASVPILTVEYEALVRNPVEETRRLIEFLGLPWDDACASHHRAGAARDAKTIAPPPTLSSEQAAKPVYDSSIGRGARFGAGLDPLREAYAEAFS